MIEINFTKWISFFFIVASSFIVAMAGNYFFNWDFQFGLLVGISLGIWNSLYDFLTDVLMAFMSSEEEDEDEEPPQQVRRIQTEEIGEDEV